jgi:hypothetical protein
MDKACVGSDSNSISCTRLTRGKLKLCPLSSALNWGFTCHDMFILVWVLDLTGPTLGAYLNYNLSYLKIDINC